MATAARKQPLYDQLVDLLSDTIQNEMHPGDALPSERDLAETYGLSRTTVRLAMSELEELGLVTRKHGKGTFVSSVSRDTTDLMGTYSFTDQMRSLGRVPHTEVIDFEVREASKFVAQNMDLRLGEAVFRMRRLRTADGVPMMLERTYMPVKVFEGLTQRMVESKSLYEIVEHDDRGRLRTGNFMSYKLPTRLDIGSIRVAFEPSYEPTGPFGAKSIGEVVINTPLAAVASAVAHATGHQVRSLPITPEKALLGE